ncbi:MAG: CidA/LrgA family protein [Alphaproteobacteria bacterium]
MIQGFIVIIGLLLIGEIASSGLALPVPGAVIGMVLLLGILIIRKSVPENVAQVADGLLAHIGLLFVPAGAGISLYLGMIADNWVVILLASFGGTVSSLVITALLFQALKRGEES